MKRIEWIDAAKGMGIFLVVLGHALPSTTVAATVIWAFHMPLFFFLSGLTAAPWSSGATPKFVRGLRGLLIPYLFFSLVSIVLFMATQSNVLTKASWTGQLQQMAYGVAGPDGRMRYNVPLWFFTCLIVVRLAFAAITSTVRARSTQLACIVFGALVAHGYLFPHFTSMMWNLDVALVALLFFTVGYCIQRLDINPADWSRTLQWSAGLVAMLVFVAAVAANGRVDMNGRSFGNPWWFYAGAFAGIALMASAATRLAHIKCIKILGQASIVIFPVHALFWLLPARAFSLVTWYASKISGADLFVSTVVAVIEISACLPLYFAIVRWAPFLIGQPARHAPVFRTQTA
ncbi:MAG: hypothetical protein EOO38_10485 [Cytophagaceae bacterium]|nr:MAG: hypothetical protein EOO38_10485 [Cytophagaceae bacterium]